METARKDLTPLVSKARADLSSLAESSKAEFQRLSEAGSASGGVFIGADGMPIILDEPAPAKVDKGKGVDRSGAAEDESTSAAPAAKETEEGATPVADTVNPGAAAAAFFAKVQTQLASNPNVKGLSKNLATLQSSVQHLPASLQTNLTQLQTQFAHIDLNESQKAAEGYLHKGENWLAEFSTEVQRLALETVKVVPPGEDTEAGRALKRREERLRKAEQVAVGRRDALVHRLRTDPETLKVDPAQPIAPVVGGGSDGKEDKPVDTREAFSVFLQTVEDKGGFEGEEWAQQVKEELEVGGSGLEKTLKDLVPGTITSEAFWSRYFFRVAQIDEDEARRKRVLEGECSLVLFFWRLSLITLDVSQVPPSPHQTTKTSPGTWKTMTNRPLPLPPLLPLPSPSLPPPPLPPLPPSPPTPPLPTHLDKVPQLLPSPPRVLEPAQTERVLTTSSVRLVELLVNMERERKRSRRVRRRRRRPRLHR